MANDVYTLDTLSNFLKEQKKLLDQGVNIWKNAFDLETHLIENTELSTQLITSTMESEFDSIEYMMGFTTVTTLDGPISRLSGLSANSIYGFSLKPGQLFTDWAVTTTTLTVQGTNNRIVDLSTDTNSRLTTNSKISVSKAEDSANNGIHTVTGVSGLVITCSGSTFTANTNDDNMIVTLVEVP